MSRSFYYLLIGGLLALFTVVTMTFSRGMSESRADYIPQTIQSQVVEIYVATFGRAPDTAGFSYWVRQVTAGDLTVDQVAMSFFDQPETNVKYPQGTSNSEFITDIYRNTLNREPDQDGLDYWTNELDRGSFGRSQAIMAIINGAKAATGNPTDAAILANKTQIGEYFAASTLGSLSDSSKMMMYAQKVMANIDETAASVATTMTYIDTLVKQAESPPVVAAKGTHLFAWNDLGMHCADSDFSIFTLLPPFNNLNAQLVVDGKLLTMRNNSEYSLVYESMVDPAGSINSFSQSKTNFWDYDQPLFGVDLIADVGLTGNPTPSQNQAPLTWNATYNWYEATGIPITPIDDNLSANYFPMVKVSALDSSGNVIASATAVLPVSSEINCNTCHASNTGSDVAKPVAGWVNMSNSEIDWRLNILRLHDERNASDSYANLLIQQGYDRSLEYSAFNNGKPVLCDGCHASNALAVWGINGTIGVSTMTAAIHNRHANVTLPGQNQTLNSIGTRISCYNCHPGQQTQCLRGAMGNPVNSTGQHLMECQSCHGSMVTVGKATREGWFDMPTCQACHHDGKRETVAINPDGTFKSWADRRFASNADAPSKGWSLFRFSTGHGKLQCEACHNSTHAEYTNQSSSNGNQINDNLQAIMAQGYAASIRECTVCHTTMPKSINGGPHGMHNLGSSWVSSHHDAFDTTPKTSCYYCHGTTINGSPLASVKVQKTFDIDDGDTKTFVANERVTCWSCHNGPNP